MVFENKSLVILFFGGSDEMGRHLYVASTLLGSFS
jgi:hypothetical protein